MSGGLDSCMTAWIMKNYYGLNVLGLFMKTWDALDDDSACNLDVERVFVEAWGGRVGIGVESVELVKEYWNCVFDPFLSGYQRGHAPNPDMLCNSRIKFGRFLEVVHERMAKIGLGRDEYVVATGHYARTHGKRLYKAADASKDQSFFLASLTKQQLENVMFPLGSLYKSHVRQAAQELSVFKPVLEKKESMGICMIGPRKLSSFLSKYLVPTPGSFLLDQKPIGMHSGAEFYTLGQLARIPSRVAPAPRMYIIEKVIRDGKLTGDLHVVPNTDNPRLWTRSIRCKHWHWLEPPRTRVQILPRTHAKCIDAVIDEHVHKDGDVLVSLSEPVWILGQGQTVVAYDGDLCVGCGIVA